MPAPMVSVSTGSVPTALGSPAAGVRSLVLVGAGPRTTGLLERIAANLDELAPSGRLVLHVVDPFPPGGGRIWRTAQSSLLWMNSTAADVTVFTDGSVSCQGPVRPGPSLAEWLVGDGWDALAAAGLGHHVDRYGPGDFVPREVQGAYLGWVFDRVVASLPDRVEVRVHPTRAVAVRDAGGGQQVELADGERLHADVVVLAQGYLDRAPSDAEAALSRAAAEHGLVHLPPAYTADLDLSVLRPGEPVLVRGSGLAFIDLLVLLGPGRGGTFSEGASGRLVYHPSGAEPVLHVGSRRGVPYHAKLGYAIAGARPTPPRYLTIEALQAMPEPVLDFDTVLLPLVLRELAGAHYRRLFDAHPERTRGSWQEFESRLAVSDVAGREFLAFAAGAVPDPGDRFDPAVVDRPLQGLRCRDPEELQQTLIRYVEADLARRADPAHSADRAVFDALLGVYGVLAWAVTSGRISGADRITRVEGSFHGLFSFLASGPPPRRLAELVAMARAGVVRFGGPDWQVTLEDGRFVGRGSAVDTAVTARALVDAWIPRPDVARTTDPVIAGLLAAGELATEELHDADGRRLEGGQLRADHRCRAIRTDGSVHPTRFLLGPSVSGSAGSSGFARPHFDAPGLRQNDAVARELLTLLAAPRVTEHPDPLRRTA